MRGGWSAEPDEFDDEEGHECEEYDDDEVDDAAGLGDDLGGLVHALLVLLELAVVVLDLVQVDQHLLVEDVQTAADGDGVGVENLDAVEEVVHALLDHVVDLLQSLQHLALLQGGFVVLLQQAVDGHVAQFEVLQGLKLAVVHFLLDLGHFLALTVDQLEEVLLEGVDDELLVLQLLLQRTHLLLHLIIPQRRSLLLPPLPLPPLPTALALHLLVELEQQRGHLPQVVLHAVLAGHQFVQQLHPLHVVPLELDAVVGQLVGGSAGHEVLTETLELIELEGRRVDLF